MDSFLNDLKRALKTGILFCAILTIAQCAWGYSAFCNRQPIQAKFISSVFGELRPATSNGISAQNNPNARFHDGTDIADCGTNSLVGAIEDGTVKYSACTVTKKGDDCSVFIKNAAQTHEFEYVHLSSADLIPANVGVVQDETIGQVDFYDHLHLNDVDRRVFAAGLWSVAPAPVARLA